MGANSSPAPFAGLSGFRGEFSTGFEMGHWNIVLRDSFGLRDFRINQDFDTYLEEELTMLELDINPGLAGWSFDEFGESHFAEVDSARGYAPNLGGELGESGAEVRRRQTWERTTRNTRYDGDYDDEDANLDFTNNLSLSVTRNADATVRPVVTVFRRDSDYWYASSEDTEPRPEWYEGATFGLVMDRPSMRFPPYISYTFVRDSDDPGWDRTMRVGIQGPGRVTDYIRVGGNIPPYPCREGSGGREGHDLRVQPYSSARPMTIHSIDLCATLRNRKTGCASSHVPAAQGGPRLASSPPVGPALGSLDDAPEEGTGDWAAASAIRSGISPWPGVPIMSRRARVPRTILSSGTRLRHASSEQPHLGALQYHGKTRRRACSAWTPTSTATKACSVSPTASAGGTRRGRGSYIENLLVLTAVRDLEGWSLGRLFGGKGQRAPPKRCFRKGARGARPNELQWRVEA